MAEYFRQAAAADPEPAWAVTFLCWLKQEVGLGRVLMDGLGLETVVRVNQPVQVCCGWGDPFWWGCAGHCSVGCSLGCRCGSHAL